ncbi:avidin/streptavidin family protein [Rhizobium cremeum]|uniref:avidin/streptavidin family protein n=1 Tax=Rhizobium cremeum TaxID=2813827 RepID=UPI000DDDE497
MKSIVFAAGVILSLSTAALAFSEFDATSFKDFSSLVSTSTTWQNQSGSTMTITVDSNDQVSGQYINRASGTGCQNSPYPISGRVNGNFIAFAVAWDNGTENCNSVTGWAGYAQASGSTIEIVTQWNLAYQGGGGPAIEQGKDLFTYVPAKNTASFLMK